MAPHLKKKKGRRHGAGSAVGIRDSAGRNRHQGGERERLDLSMRKGENSRSIGNNGHKRSQEITSKEKIGKD